MKRAAVLFLLATVGCTADFFVGPTEAGSSGGQGPASEGMPDDDGGPGGPTSDMPDPGTTGMTTPDTSEDMTSTGPTLTTEGDTESPTGDSSDLETSSSTTAATGETEEPGDCVSKDAEPCELAFPVCLWDGEACEANPCHVEAGERACLELSPECIWEEGGCIPSGCEMETECSGLDIELCGMTKGCIDVIDTCFAIACAPCTEVDNPKLCAELPNCTYNEGLEACQPL
jgi:hypothetical protein